MSGKTWLPASVILKLMSRHFHTHVSGDQPESRLSRDHDVAEILDFFFITSELFSYISLENDIKLLQRLIDSDLFIFIFVYKQKNVWKVQFLFFESIWKCKYLSESVRRVRAKFIKLVMFVFLTLDSVEFYFSRVSYFYTNLEVNFDSAMSPQSEIEVLLKL